MNLKFDRDHEAYAFLTRVVLPNGEFRIHTNKKGIRLYLAFTATGLTGYSLQYVRRYTGGQKTAPFYIHPQNTVKTISSYAASHVGANLHEALNLHLTDLPYEQPTHVVPCEEQFSCGHNEWTKVSELTLKEFLRLPELKFDYVRGRGYI